MVTVFRDALMRPNEITIEAGGLEMSHWKEIARIFETRVEMRVFGTLIFNHCWVMITAGMQMMCRCLIGTSACQNGPGSILPSF